MSLVFGQPKRVYPVMPKMASRVRQYPPYALLFNGVDGRVYLGNPPSLNPTNAITVEGFVKLLSVGEKNPRWVAKSNVDFTNSGYMAYCDRWTGKYIFTVGNGSTRAGAASSVIGVGKLLHIVGTYDSTEVRIYVNGVLQGVASLSGGLGVNNHDVYVSSWDASDDFWNGYIYLVRIYNRALSQAEIWHNMYNPLSPVRDGLVLWLPFLEGSGTTVKDYSGLGNNGTLYGGVSWIELAKYEIPAAIGY